MYGVTYYIIVIKQNNSQYQAVYILEGDKVNIVDFFDLSENNSFSLPSFEKFVDIRVE